MKIVISRVTWRVAAWRRIEQRAAWVIRLTLLGLISVPLLALAQPEDADFRGAIARGDYASALTFHPDNVPLWDHWIAVTASQQPAVAARLLAQFAAIEGWTVARRRQYADLLAAQGDVSDAYRLRRALLPDAPNNLALWQQVSAADIARRSWPEAIADLSHLAALTPTDGETLYSLAVLLTLDQPDQALHYLGLAVVQPAVHDKALSVSQLLSRLPHNAALAQIGLNLAAAGDWALADYVLARASALNKTDMALLAMYGVAQEQKGHLDDGWLLIAQAALQAPTDPVVSYALAAHWQRLGNWDSALAVMNAAEARDPNNPALAEQIGLIYEQHGATDPAAHWLLLAVQLAPTNPDFSQALAELYADQSYLLDSGGMVFIQSAVKLFPTNAGLHASLGAALFATGQTVAAIAELRQAVALDPSSARAGYYLAEALERSGDVVGATQAYRAAAQPALFASNDSTEAVFRQLAERAVARLSPSG